MNGEWLFNLGFLLVFVGFLITFVAAILLMFKIVKGKAKVRGGGAVIIGLFPIIFGTDKESVKVLLILSIALVVFLLVFIAFSYYTLK